MKSKQEARMFLPALFLSLFALFSWGSGAYALAAFGPFTGPYTGSGSFNFRMPVNANTVQSSGNQIRVNLAAGTTSLTVVEAFIGERASTGDLYDMVPGTVKPITFDGGKAGVLVAASGTKYSDWVGITFDRTKNYVISLGVTGGFRAWNPAGAGAYYSSGAQGSSDVATVSGYQSSTAIYVLERLEVDTTTTGGTTTPPSSGGTVTASFGPFTGPYTGSGSFNFRMPVNANTLQTNGTQARINLAAGTTALTVVEAFIGERASSGDVYDMVPGTVKAITFDGGKSGAVVTASGTKYSDWIGITLDRTKNYVISLGVTGGFRAWNPAGAGAYYSSDAQGSSDVATVSGYQASPAVYALERLEVAGGTVVVNPPSDGGGTTTPPDDGGTTTPPPTTGGGTITNPAYEIGAMVSTTELASVMAPAKMGSGTTYYVDSVSGSDSNDGRSTSTAWRTVSKVNSVSLSPGSNVLFKRGGVWREKLNPKSGTSSSYVYYGAYGSGNRPVMNGANLVTGWSNQGGYVWRASLSSSPEAIYINDSRGTKQSSTGSLTRSGDWYYSSGSLYVYSSSTPSLVEAPARDFCITSGASYVVVSNFDCKFSMHYGIYAAYGARYWIIEGNKAHHIGGIEFDRAGIMCEASYSQIRNNEVYQSAANGIDTYSGGSSSQLTTNVIVEGNFVYECVHSHIDIQGSVDVIARYNRITGTNIPHDATGFFCGNNYAGLPVIRPRIYGNVVYNFKGNGIQVDDDTQNAVVYNNTVSNCTNFNYYFNNKSNSDIIRNNIGISTSGSSKIIRIVNTSNKTVDNNCWYSTTGTMATIGSGSNYSTFSSYVSATGFDRNSLNQNPLCVNATGGNFALQSGSPCINKGVDLGADYNGGIHPNSTWPGAVYIVKQKSVAAKPVEEAAVDESEAKPSPTPFALTGNYPNPFNPSTTIEFSIDAQSQVELAVYNIAGQKVAVLENRVMNAGKYSVVWDAANLSSGMYFARLTSNKGVLTRKMLFLK